MKEIKETCYKGTRILIGNEKRSLINAMVDDLVLNGFEEISIPVIQHYSSFDKKLSDENEHQIFNFMDKGDRHVCLAPEYTAVIQQLANTTFKHNKDVKLFYVQECFRGEKPQAGRYRQFTQIGVEILNPTQDYRFWLAKYSMNLMHRYMGGEVSLDDFTMNLDTSRGLDYYKEGRGFEVTCDKLGAQKQLCGGGEYDGGVGFAIGIDRLLLLKQKPGENESQSTETQGS